MASILSLAVSGCNTPPSREKGESAVTEAKLMELGQKAESRGDTDTAIAFYRQANTGFPNAIGPVQALAEAYSRIGAHRNAALSFARLSELSSPENMAPTRVFEGRSWLKARNPAKAALAFETALHHDVTNTDAMIGLGVSQDIMGRNGQAKENYLRALELLPDNRSARNNLALSHMISGQPETAVTLLEKLMEDYPDQANYRHNLSMALVLAGQPGEARTVLERNIQGERLENDLAAFGKLRDMSAQERAQFIFNSQLLGSMKP